MTNPPTKRVEMPRASLGEHVVFRDIWGQFQQGIIRTVSYVNGLGWQYSIDLGNEILIFDKDILINSSRQIDYQEEESKPTCLHRWKIIGQLPNLTGEECELCGRIIGTR